MSMLKEDDKKAVKEFFKELVNPVKLVMFTQESECEYCSHTRELVEDVAALSDKIELEVHDFLKDKAKAEEYGIDKVPAVVLVGERDYGIRFYGIPAGYEFTTLIEDIVDVSKRDHGLGPEIVEQLSTIDRPVKMQVMVTPNCPHCTRAVRTAHRFAMASEHITGEMVETSEFPQLAVKYRVSGVPDTIVNENHRLLGGQPVGEFLRVVKEAAAAFH